jgi:hypothetical protein
MDYPTLKRTADLMENGLVHGVKKAVPKSRPRRRDVISAASSVVWPLAGAAGQFGTALNSRVIIEQAQGQARRALEVDMDQAFTLLRDRAHP